ncbi:MAG: hypothetical protein U9Q72_02035 [Patescibacteria group bacterium]|nr:hypothetical protein [Patescibacteria group bacterium]MEA3494829.1 hypothetical protein [Bacteroidota bacterium]
MLGAFAYQLFLGLVFFLGILGAGLYFIKILNYKAGNYFLRIATAFLVSFCIYVLILALALFIFPWNIFIIQLVSAIYFVVSFLILTVFWVKNKKNITLERVKDWFRQNYLVVAGLLFTLIVFFLGSYQTALLDEHLHRPVIKFFTTNGEFPLINPIVPDQKFMLTYHYGTQLAASAIKLIFLSSVSVAMDILKISFLMSGYMLFVGIVMRWSKNVNWAVLGSVLIIFCGGSFFLFDEFTIEHLQLWGIPAVVLNYPLLYSLLGITWVNLLLATVSTILLEQIFYYKIKINWRVVAIAVPIMGGFFLISELFAALTLFGILFLAIYNLCKRRISFVKTLLVAISFSVILWLSFYLLGGVIGNMLEGSGSATNLISFRHFSLWGYPTGGDPVRIWEFPEIYLRNFFLEAILFLMLIYFLIKRKVSLFDHPVYFFFIAVAFLTPFFFSTSFNDLNLYKLTHFGIILLHLLFFWLFFKSKNKRIFIPILVLFVIGSIPIILVNSAIQWLGTERSEELRCIQNNTCYDKDLIIMLEQFEKDNCGLKRVLTSSRDDSFKIIDNTNSVTVQGNFKKLDFSPTVLDKYKVDYLFFPLTMVNKLSEEVQENIKKYPLVSSSEDYQILRVKK